MARFTLVIPGKSTRVRLRTLGEKIFKYMGSGLIPWKNKDMRIQYLSEMSQRPSFILVFFLTLFSPEVRSVSTSISRQISLKSVKTFYLFKKDVLCVKIKYRKNNSNVHIISSFQINLPGSCNEEKYPIPQL